jgi:Rps23 Pro-64 3,4-dihydroxylase Tpa1-like proline 4-hydroxylase
VAPKHTILRNFFAGSIVSRLLECAIAQEARFEPSGIVLDTDPGKIDPSIRKSMKLKSLGPIEKELRDNLGPLAPELTSLLAVTPFEASHLELEIVAHGDGAFYRRHVDTFMGGASHGRQHERMLSGVYYFHADPKGFSGGALRLYSFVPSPDEKDSFVDIDPEHNSLVVFPSWAPHEVMPVICPSGRFIDSRFALNCWFCRKTTEVRQLRGSGNI